MTMVMKTTMIMTMTTMVIMIVVITSRGH